MHDLVRALSLAAVLACALAAIGARAQGCPNTCTSESNVVMGGLRCPDDVDTTLCARLAALEAPPPPTSSSGAVVPSPPPPAVDALACAPGDATLCARLAALEATLESVQDALAAANAARLGFEGTIGMIVLTTGACPPGFTPTGEYNERFLAFGSAPGVHGPIPTGPLSARTIPLPPITNTLTWSATVPSPPPPNLPGSNNSAQRFLQVSSGQTSLAQSVSAPFAYMIACIKQ